MNKEISDYNKLQTSDYKTTCELMAQEIQHALPKAQSKIWHGSPVWFIDGNPVAGYSVLKDCVRLLFWSGQSFDEDGLSPEGSFMAAEARYTDVGQVDVNALRRWLKKCETIQWDYKNIVKKRGQLDRLR